MNTNPTNNDDSTKLLKKVMNNEYCSKAIIHYISNQDNSTQFTKFFIDSIENNSPIIMDNLNFGSLLESLFLYSDSYSGTTDHLPSQYMRKNQVYLNAHSRMSDLLTKSEIDIILGKEKKINSRIIVCDKSDLVNNMKNNPKEYKDFIQWHDSRNVALYSIDEKISFELSVKNNVLSMDMGVWPHMCTLIFPRNVKRTDEIKDKRIFYFYPRRTEVLQEDNFSRSVNYIKEVNTYVKANCDPLGNIAM